MFISLPSLSPSPSPSLSLSLYLSLSPSVSISISIYLYLYIYISVYLSISPCVSWKRRRGYHYEPEIQSLIERPCLSEEAKLYCGKKTTPKSKGFICLFIYLILT